MSLHACRMDVARKSQGLCKNVAWRSQGGRKDVNTTKTRWGHAKKSRSGSPRPKWKPSWPQLQKAKEKNEEQARIQDKLEEWDFERAQERLDEGFKVYCKGFQAGSSGDDFVRGWASTKRQVLRLNVP